MSAWVPAVALLAAAVGLGYGLRMVRPARALFEWAENQLDGDGWARWFRRYPAAVILGVALAVHPLRSRRAYLDNKQRAWAGTEFTGAMRPAVKYDPDWYKTGENDA